MKTLIDRDALNILDYTIDRYAKAIINNDQSRFDAIELQGVRSYPVDDSKGSVEYTVDNENPDGFSVYLHLIEGGVECVGDFSRYTDALQYTLELSDELSLEITDYARPA